MGKFVVAYVNPVVVKVKVTTIGMLISDVSMAEKSKLLKKESKKKH